MTHESNDAITEEKIIEKFKKQDLSTYPDVHSYATKAEPILWVLWIIKTKFKIDAYIPAGMLANIMVDGIGKFADSQSIKNALARSVGNNVHRKKVDGQPVYKIMEDGIKHLEKLEEKSNKGEFEKIYKPGQQYNIYKDLRKIFLKAKKEVFIVDAYPDESLYDLYVDLIPQKTPIKILTNSPPRKFVAVGKLLSQQRTLNIVDNPNVHDRYIFADNECWMIGSSIKDAAKKKPTTLVKLRGAKDQYKLWYGYFKSGKKLV